MVETKFPALEYFREVNRTFPKTREILELKQAGTKVFGWVCTYVPEEIIHAAGALPIRVTGYNQEMELEDGNAFLYINNCSFSRSCLQMGLRGEYDFLDGFVACSTCDGTRRLFDLWKHYLKVPFYHILTVPRKYNEKAHTLYRDQVIIFKELLEQSVGTKITDDALLRSINLYNETRRLLRQLYDLRKLDEPLVTGTQVMEVLNAGFRMSKEQFNKYLQQFLYELKEAGVAHSSRARVMVSGSIMNNPEFIKNIEDLGALVVTDELCTSTRYWSDLVALEGQTPITAVARRYLDNFPCARMVPSDGRFNRIIDLVKDYRVEGNISQIIRYCVQYCHDLPQLTAKLNKIGVPTLSLDVEYGTSGSGQIRTRVQAFLEMLEARKK